MITAEPKKRLRHFKVGDEVKLEGFSRTLTIAKIDENYVYLYRNIADYLIGNPADVQACHGHEVEE